MALLPALLYLAAITFVLGFTDLTTHRLPNAIVLPSYLVISALLCLASAITGDWWALARALAAGAVLFGAYFLMVLAYPRGMGWGDVKLAGVLGLVLGWLGWGSLVVGGFAAFLLGGLWGIVLVLLRRGRTASIPFGPWMLLGAWIGVIWGEMLWRCYLSLVGLS